MDFICLKMSINSKSIIFHFFYQPIIFLVFIFEDLSALKFNLSKLNLCLKTVYINAQEIIAWLLVFNFLLEATCWWVWSDVCWAH